MVGRILVSGLICVLLAGCNEEGKTSTYTQKEIREAWNKYGPGSSIVATAAKECQNDLDIGLGHITLACRNYEVVSLEVASKKFVEDALKTK